MVCEPVAIKEDHRLRQSENCLMTQNTIKKSEPQATALKTQAHSNKKSRGREPATAYILIQLNS
jgi:hypothetical protein